MASKSLYLPTSVNDSVVFFIGSPWGLFFLWLALINLTAFLAFGIDKWKAKRPNARRIPERTLFFLAMLGGSIGALLGMKVWHHKTLHKTFTIGIPVILILQIVLGSLVYWNFIR